MRRQTCLWIALVLRLVALPALAAEPQAGSAPDTTPPPLVLAGQSLVPQSQSCNTPLRSVPIGDTGLVLMNVPPGPLDPAILANPASIDVCNCTFSNCGNCSPPPCILCLNSVCHDRLCLSTVGSCKNGLCGHGPP